MSLLSFIGVKNSFAGIVGFSPQTILKKRVSVWMLLAQCSESISHNHTAHIKKCPDSIVGKRQRSQAFLIYSYIISTAIGTWHSVLQSQHSKSLLFSSILKRLQSEVSQHVGDTSRGAVFVILVDEVSCTSLDVF